MLKQRGNPALMHLWRILALLTLVLGFVLPTAAPAAAARSQAEKVMSGSAGVVEILAFENTLPSAEHIEVHVFAVSSPGMP